MAESSGFFTAMIDEDTGRYDRAYIARQFADYFSLFIGNGVFGSPTNQLLVKPGTNGLSVIVSQGYAFIHGYWYYNDSDKVIPLVTNYGSVMRTDSVRVRMSEETRDIKVDVFTDDAELERGEDIYDLQLATVQVPPFAESITASHINDTRPDQEVCGFVTGLMSVQTTADLFSQYQAMFDEWFETIKGQLSEDAAGNLQNQIVDLQTIIQGQNRLLTDLVFGQVVWSCYPTYISPSVCPPPSNPSDGYRKILFSFKNSDFGGYFKRGAGYEVLYYDFVTTEPKETGTIIENVSSSYFYPPSTLLTTGRLRMFGVMSAEQRFSISASIGGEQITKYTGSWVRRLRWNTMSAESWGGDAFTIGLEMNFYAEKVSELNSATETMSESVRVCLPACVIVYGYSQRLITKSLWENGQVVDNRNLTSYGIEYPFYLEE